MKFLGAFAFACFVLMFSTMVAVCHSKVVTCRVGDKYEKVFYNCRRTCECVGGVKLEWVCKGTCRRDVPIAVDLQNTPCAPSDYFIIDCNTCYCNIDQTGYLCTENICIQQQENSIPSTTQIPIKDKVLVIANNTAQIVDNIKDLEPNSTQQLPKIDVSKLRNNQSTGLPEAIGELLRRLNATLIDVSNSIQQSAMKKAGRVFKVEGSVSKNATTPRSILNVTVAPPSVLNRTTPAAVKTNGHLVGAAELSAALNSTHS